MITIAWPQQQKGQSRVGLRRLPVLAGALALLLAALWAGLLRLGWS